MSLQSVLDTVTGEQAAMRDELSSLRAEVERLRAERAAPGRNGPARSAKAIGSKSPRSGSFVVAPVQLFILTTTRC